MILKDVKFAAYPTMRGSRNFRQGGQVSLTRKSSDNVFFSFFFKFSAYFTEVKWSILEKSIIFQGPREGPTFSRGGSNFFQGGGGPMAYSL